jgi:hypothetical protein
VLSVRPLVVVPARLVWARATGGADLLPARLGLGGVIQHRRVPVAPGEDLAERHVLKVVRRAQRLAAPIRG